MFQKEQRLGLNFEHAKPRCYPSAGTKVAVLAGRLPHTQTDALGLSVIVRLAGPAFSSDDNREAFERIEESIRQFSTHTRETFALIRNPVDITSDHFVLLWSRGAALVLLIPYGGEIRGSLHGPWTVEEQGAYSISETTIENPIERAAQAARMLQQMMGAAAGKPAVGVHEAEIRLEERHEPTLASLAIFTCPVTSITIGGQGQALSAGAISLEYALSRTVFHMPNVLRLSDSGAIAYGAPEIEVLSAELDRRAAVRVTSPALESTGPQRFRRSQRPRTKSHVTLWAFIGVAIVTLLYVALRPGEHAILPPSGEDSSAHLPARRAVSTVVIRLPVETQLVVADSVFERRSDLDNALGHGTGIRYLPDTMQIIHLDSVRFAKGVYGYFKVDNMWRKGKLLQTFRSRDTFVVDNFLEPLK